VADFHALRHTYVSRLERSSANTKVTQELARHSTPTLTLGRYAHIELLDQKKVLDALPSLEHAPIRQDAARATSTEHATAAQARSALSARQRPEALKHDSPRRPGGRRRRGGRRNSRNGAYLWPPVNGSQQLAERPGFEPGEQV